MIEFDSVVRIVSGIGATELRSWVEEGWLRPVNRQGAYVFDEIDIARARLIRDLRRQLAIGPEAMPVVLHLLDQVYAMRRALRTVNEAIAAQPLALRRNLHAALKNNVRLHSRSKEKRVGNRRSRP
jgi:chaperone modulatory protein CbpM